MTDGDNPNRYPGGSIFMDCQGSELKDLETVAVNRTAWRQKVAILVFYYIIGPAGSNMNVMIYYRAYSAL